MLNNQNVFVLFFLEMRVWLPGNVPKRRPRRTAASVCDERRQPAAENRCLSTHLPPAHPAGPTPGEPAGQRQDRKNAHLRRHLGLPGAHRTSSHLCVFSPLARRRRH